jgi:hypothetical protein
VVGMSMGRMVAVVDPARCCRCDSGIETEASISHLEAWRGLRIAGGARLQHMDRILQVVAVMELARWAEFPGAGGAGGAGGLQVGNQAARQRDCQRHPMRALAVPRPGQSLPVGQTLC